MGDFFDTSKMAFKSSEPQNFRTSEPIKVLFLKNKLMRRLKSVKNIPYSQYIVVLLQ